MPLARIITDSVDDSLELTMQLRSRGFQVETVAPGEIPTTPADLEVRLEECNSEDVLTRTAQVSEADDLWVFVAPGALDESRRPIRTIPLMPPVVRIPDVKATLQPRPKVPAAPPVAPFIAPDDDPILLELHEFQKQAAARTTVGTRPTNGNGTHAAHVEKAVPSPAPAVILSTKVPVEEVPEKISATPVPALRIADHQAEVVLFPTAPDSHSHAQPVQDVGRVSAPVTGERAQESSADLRFWRIACVAAGLAIAALLFGVNLSQTANAPVAAPQAAAPKRSAVPSSRTAGVVPAKSKPVVSATAKPPAGERKAAKPTRPQTATVTTSRRNARTAQPKRHVPRAHPDDIIATDTVVFFDRKGSPSPQKTKSVPAVKHHSDLD